jgi:hypothetical protein
MRAKTGTRQIHFGKEFSMLLLAGAGSNLGMAELKSKWFEWTISAHSEKSRKYQRCWINGLASNSERQSRVE